MKTRFLSLLPLAVFCLVVSVWPQEHFNVASPIDNIPDGKLFTVRHSGDTEDANPGDDICADTTGNCTLRAAIIEANANKGFPDTIIFDLPYPAVLELTRGSLDLGNGLIRIIGPGARKLTVRRGASAAVSFRLFTITNITNGKLRSGNPRYPAGGRPSREFSSRRGDAYRSRCCGRHV